LIDRNDWEAAKRAFPPGARVTGTVQAQVPFGVFVNIPDSPFQGLIMLVHFKDGERMTKDELPPVGSRVSAVVLGHKEFEHQIVLSVRPSDLGVNFAPRP
jgi:ribosomal protein S1